MKKLLLIVFVLYVCGVSAQDIEELKNDMELLKIEKENYQNKILEVDKKIIMIKRTIDSLILLESSKNKFVCKTVTKCPAKFMATPKISGEVIIVIPKKKTLSVLEYVGDTYWKTSYENQIGYMSDITLFLTDQMIIAKESYDNDKTAKEIEAVKLREQKIKEAEVQRIEKLKEKYGIFGYSIAKGKVVIGMTAEMVRESMGRPDDINTSKGSWGVHEQWIYSKKDMYVYIENGKVTSIQY